jgi:hypothetical protein
MRDLSLHRITTLIIRALLDWTILSVIRGRTLLSLSLRNSDVYLLPIDHDAILERVLYSLNVALLVLIASLHNNFLSLTLIAGSVVALWSSISYASKELYKSHHLYVTAVRKLETRDFFSPNFL